MELNVFFDNSQLLETIKLVKENCEKKVKKLV